MGKYMRKSKVTIETISILDISQASSVVGVRTRAKTLALSKLKHSDSNSTPAEGRPEYSYLQLRTRRLEKPCCRSQNPNPNPNPRFVHCGGEETEEEGVCIGENDVDDVRERSTRESTPCNSIKDMNVICTPGSSTKPRHLEASNRLAQDTVVTRIMPLAHEIDDFFAHHEQEQQRRFAEKYNFDTVNENPLEGRYEWVSLQSQ